MQYVVAGPLVSVLRVAAEPLSNVLRVAAEPLSILFKLYYDLLYFDWFGNTSSRE